MSPRQPSPRPRGRPKGRGRIDWGAIETLYVHGELQENGTRKFPSAAALATRFGVGVGSVQGMVAEQDWRGKREAFQRRLRDEIDAECVKNAASEAGRLAGVGLRAAAEVALMLRALLGPEAPPGDDTRWVGPQAEAIDRANKLSMIYKNLCHGVYLVRAVGGPGGASPSTEEPPKDPTPEATRAAAIDAMTAANEAPPTHGAAPSADEG